MTESQSRIRSKVKTLIEECTMCQNCLNLFKKEKTILFQYISCHVHNFSYFVACDSEIKKIIKSGGFWEINTHKIQYHDTKVPSLGASGGMW